MEHWSWGLLGRICVRHEMYAAKRIFDRLRIDKVLVRTLPAVLGYGAALAVILGTFDYTGGVLTGYNKDPNVDEYERKEFLRKNRRKPIQETIEDLGEGRGMLASFDVCDSL